MVFALLGDIHGNAPALEAALAAIDEEGIHVVLCTGDCVVGHPWPNEVVDILRARGIPAVQGEWDHHALRFRRKEAALRQRLSAEEAAALEDTFTRCSAGTLEFLRSLPRARTETIDGIDVALAHGLLTTQHEGLAADAPEERFRRQREISPVPIMCLGRTHEAYSRVVDDTLFVNPGSIGMDAEGARYTVVFAEEKPWHAEIRCASYA